MAPNFSLSTGGPVGSRGSAQAGIELEQQLSVSLDKLGIPNSLTRGDPYNIEERIDLRVPALQFSGRPDFEFQLTLKKGVQRKMRDFVLAAMKNQDRGIRVYLEVAASRWHDLSYIATRVAFAIKDIVRRWKHFEDHNILGVRVRVGRPRQPSVERFSLLDRVGEWARERYAKLLAHQAELDKQRELVARRQALEEQRARMRNLRNSPRPPKINYPIPNWYRWPPPVRMPHRSFMDVLAHQRRQYVPRRFP